MPCRKTKVSGFFHFFKLRGQNCISKNVRKNWNWIHRLSGYCPLLNSEFKYSLYICCSDLILQILYFSIHKVPWIHYWRINNYQFLLRTFCCCPCIAGCKLECSTGPFQKIYNPRSESHRLIREGPKQTLAPISELPSHQLLQGLIWPEAVRGNQRSDTPSPSQADHSPFPAPGIHPNLMMDPNHSTVYSNTVILKLQLHPSHLENLVKWTRGPQNLYF